MRGAATLSRGLLGHAARLYADAAHLRRRAYERGWLPRTRLPVPVISVGGLSMGGTGKTPVAALVARLLQRQGRKVSLVCGAYGGLRRRRPTLIPAVGDARCVRHHGDEAVMLARWLAPVPVVGGMDKAACATLALERGAEVVVVDDGFQHLALQRELDIVVLGGARLPATLPAGPGREDARALRSAALLWYHLCPQQLVPPHTPTGADVVVSRYVPRELLRWRGSTLVGCGSPETLQGARVALVLGVAAPRRFHALVRSLGATVVFEHVGLDHGRFSTRLLRRARRTSADLLLCTEKDLIRMTQTRWGDHLVALGCDVQLQRGTGVLQRALVRSLGSRGRGG